MSTTLKRKMFKMGGKVDAHGVGITSGLEKRTGINQKITQRDKVIEKVTVVLL